MRVQLVDGLLEVVRFLIVLKINCIQHNIGILPTDAKSRDGISIMIELKNNNYGNVMLVRHNWKC